MSYQALYRAWRPEGFSTIVGQEPITTTLVNQIKTGRIGHAYLFCGSRGTGKTTTAKVFARAINCLQPKENGDPCGTCEACRALAMDANMDVIEIDAASNNGVDEIRELRDKIKYPPSVGRYKVYIVDEVHMLSSGAFNALLKTLEEPPSHAVFILATTEPQKLPATILSRCQRYDFKRISAQGIVGKLQMELAAMGRDAEPEALSDIARAAEGGMRDAESLLDMCLAYSGGTVTAALVRDVLGATDRAGLFAFASALSAGDAAEALRQIDRQMREGRDAQVFAREAAGHMRALMLAQLMPGELAGLLDLAQEDAARYTEQAHGVAQEKLARIMELFTRAEAELRWASQPRSVLELCAVRACRPEREQSVEALLERVQALEAKLAGGAFVAAPAQSAPAIPQPTEDDEPPFDMVVPTDPERVLAPAAPSSPTPSPSTATPPEWTAAAALVKEKDKGLFGPLSKLSRVQIDGDTARILFQKKDNMYMNLLRAESKLKQLEALISEAFGRPMRAVIAEDAPGGSKPVVASAPARSNIEQVYDVFGRDVVSVVDEL